MLRTVFRAAIPLTRRLNVSSSRKCNILRFPVRSLSSKHTGLFGLPGLQKSSDFPRLAKVAIAAVDSLRSYIHENPDLKPSETLALMDSISSELCAVLDAAELCRNVHQSDAFKQAAEDAFEELSHFLHILNADTTLHARLRAIMEGPHWSKLSTEERLFTENLRQEFESDGIHLVGKQREHALQLRQLVVDSETRYSQNLISVKLADPGSLIQVGPFPNVESSSHLHSWLAQYIPQDKNTHRAAVSGGVYVTASKDKSIANALLRTIDIARVREKLWYDAYLHPSANITPLGKLIQSRQAVAKCLGYDSYVHKALYNRAYKTPVEVKQLLRMLAQASQSYAEQELAVLRAAKAKQESKNRDTDGGSSNIWSSLFGGDAKKNTTSTTSTSTATANANKSRADADAAPLFPWDMLYYNTHSHTANNNNSTSVAERERAVAVVKQFLPLDACIDGLRLLSRKLFNIDLQKDTIGEHEGWLTESGDNSGDRGRSESAKNSLGDELLQKYTVKDIGTGAVIGTVWMDLYERDNKFPGSAHFTVQCGCVRTHLRHVQDSSATTPAATSTASSSYRLEESAQLPIVALVFHFPRPTKRSQRGGSVGGSGGGGQHALLSLRDVETLHHEWGHALHSLLSKTKFQHLSGTRGGSDFVEVPSHWCEYYARTPSVIAQWARHYITGEKVPLRLLETALENAQPFPALDLQNQILYSAVDQYLFGTEMGDVSGLTPQQVFERALEGVAQVQQEYTILPVAPSVVGGIGSSGDNNGTTTVASSAAAVNVAVDRKSVAQRDQCGLPHHQLSIMNLLDHGHLVNYGGGYYSYLFAKLHAAQIWQTYFAADPLNREAGAYLNENLFSLGSSRPAAEVLNKLTGGKLDASHFLQRILK